MHCSSHLLQRNSILDPMHLPQYLAKTMPTMFHPSFSMFHSNILMNLYLFRTDLSLLYDCNFLYLILLFLFELPIRLMLIYLVDLYYLLLGLLHRSCIRFRYYLNKLHNKIRCHLYDFRIHKYDPINYFNSNLLHLLLILCILFFHLSTSQLYQRLHDL